MRDRDLVRLYWPVDLRPAFDALFAIDDVMAEVVASSTQPALGAIRLAWWREALERLDTEKPPPEPRLQAAARELLGRGVSRLHLAGIPDGWSALLDEFPDPDVVGGRGASIFAVGACLLRATNPRLMEVGSWFAFSDAQRRGFGEFAHSTWSIRIDPPLRPLTALAALAARDLQRTEIEPEATPGRAFTLLRHRFTGRIDWPD